jgi:hypothetical protein
MNSRPKSKESKGALPLGIKGDASLRIKEITVNYGDSAFYYFMFFIYSMLKTIFNALDCTP